MKSEKVNVGGPSDGLKKAALLESAKQRSPRLKFAKKIKSLTVEKPFLDECPKYFFFFFFQLPDLKNDILGVGEVAPVYQVIKNLKNLKMDHLGFYSMPVTVLLNTCIR